MNKQMNQWIKLKEITMKKTQKTNYQNTQMQHTWANANYFMYTYPWVCSEPHLCITVPIAQKQWCS